MEQIMVLRRTTVLVCILWSCLLGLDMAVLSVSLIVTTWAYDSVGLAGHPVGKNLCNICGYTIFETAAVKLIGMIFLYVA